MNFYSDTVRAAFHALPTDTQLAYSRLEYLLADTGRMMTIAGITIDPLNDGLEVMVRITDQLNLDPGSTDG